MTHRSVHRSLAQLGAFFESDETIGRVIGGGRLQTASKTWIDSGRIHWSGGGGQEAQPTPEILDRFLFLWDKTDAEILRFFRAYGPPRRPLWVLRNENSRLGYEGSETIDTCKGLSRRTHDLLIIASTLRTEDTSKLKFDHWNDLSNGRLRELQIKPRVRLLATTSRDDVVDIVKRYLYREVALWNATYGPVTMSIGPDYDNDLDSGLKTILDFGGSVLCYIGLQLMMVIAGGDIFICSACGLPYRRSRGRDGTKGMRKTPKPGERNYCQSAACIRERNRLASGRYRASLGGTKKNGKLRGTSKHS